MTVPSPQPGQYHPGLGHTDPVLPYTAPGSNVGRGTLLSLLTVPIGVVLWLIIWGFGFIASLVGALVAFLAVTLYVKGAGRITKGGALIVIAVTAVTLLLSFIGGIALDFATSFGQINGVGTLGAFGHENFWPRFSDVLPDAFPEYLPDFALATLFGAAGAFSVLRSAFSGSGEAEPTQDDQQAADAGLQPFAQTYPQQTTAQPYPSAPAQAQAYAQPYPPAPAQAQPYPQAQQPYAQPYQPTQPYPQAQQPYPQAQQTYPPAAPQAQAYPPPPPPGP